jgi:acyl-coenzyme A thioesterase PaaI-like protein
MPASHLHLELTRPIPVGTRVLHCTGVPRAIEDGFGLSEGEVVTNDDVVVARASLGAVLFPPGSLPLTTDESVPHGQVMEDGNRRPRRHRLLRSSPIHDALETDVVRAGRTGVWMTNPAAPRFANLKGGVFGGVGVLMGERAMDLAVRASAGESRPMRPVELRAAYVRPIPADGALMESHARVMYRGRRLAVVRGEVLAPDGRVGVLIDGSYIPRVR